MQTNADSAAVECRPPFIFMFESHTKYSGIKCNRLFHIGHVKIDILNACNHPFGSVLVVDGIVVLSAENSVVTDNDITAHAETNLIRLAFKTLDRQIIERSTLYISTEPCAMCAGAIYWAKIRQFVFGCSVTEMARHTSGSLVIHCREIFAKGREPTEVVGPWFGERSASLHAEFWRSY